MVPTRLPPNDATNTRTTGVITHVGTVVDGVCDYFVVNLCLASASACWLFGVLEVTT